MGLNLDYPDGATPLDPDEVAGLIPAHISTQGQLNEWEQANITEGEQWAFGRRHKNILSREFMQALHKRMFRDTWRWAGEIRKTEKNIGIAPHHIYVELKKLLDDVALQLASKDWEIDEIAARFHHRLVSIHPFPNGNGRFSRTMTDLLLVQNGRERFTWGAGDLVRAGDARQRYIHALQAADKFDYSLLLAFLVRSWIL